MLSNFILSVNAVVPIFILIFLGSIIKHKKFLDYNSIKHMNAIVFNAALPVMLFRDIYDSDFGQIFDITFICYAVATTCLIFALLWLFSTIFIRDKRAVGAFVQGAFRSNYAIIGLPIIANILGGLNTGKGILITTFIIPVYNILSVVVLTFTSENKDNKAIFSAIKNIAKNPLIIGVFAGLLFSFLDISLPQFFKVSINYMSGMATPLALIVIGGSININESLENLKLALIASIIKLVIVPVIFVPIGICFGLDTEELVVLFVMYSAPTAISSYIMTANMEGNTSLSINIILLTTLFSIITFTLGAFLFYTYLL